MIKAILIGLAGALAFCAFWVGTYFIFKAFGFENQATPFYGFTSGVGPMLLTALGMGSIVGSMWHTMNCHEEGCWNLGKHKVNGTPWCNLHHEAARHAKTSEQILTEILTTLEDISARI